MVFSSTVFLFLFLPITILVYYNPIIQTRTFRNIFLLMASMFFYAWGEPFFVILMLVSILVGWYIGKKMDASSKSVMRRKYLFCGVFFHVGLLFVFKYLGFTVREMGGGASSGCLVVSDSIADRYFFFYISVAFIFI